MKKQIVAAFAVFGLVASAQSVYPGQFDGKFTVSGGKTAIEAFDLGDVRLLPGRVRQNQERDSVWMVNISPDRLVHSFRNNAGVFASREGGYMAVKKYGGWESFDCDLRGHTTGHLLSAYALMYAATGEDVFRLKADTITTALAQVQKALGGGYLSAFPEELINRNIAGQGVWAPWYTLHKIMAGLIDQYLYCNNTTALEIARGMTGWAYGKLKDLDAETRARMLRNEFGGINEAFYNMYAITGDEKALFLANYFYHNDVIDPLYNRTPDYGTKHTNTFIPKVIAEMRRAELLGDTAAARVGSDFMRHMLSGHVFAPGCLSDKEHFFSPGTMSKHVSGYTGETCCTYNMLKLARHLFCMQPDAALADYCERALYNHILGQQDPQTGMVAYFLPLLSGSHKVYSTPENSFWCCVGSGFESHAKYAESIYFHSNDDLYVNLFIPSELDWKDKGITIRQHTEFPYKQNSTITIDAEKPVTADINLRWPSWCRDMGVKVNGRSVKVKGAPGSYVSIDRKWRSGDKIEVTLPMHLYTEAVHDDPSTAALLYGPVVLAADLGTEGMQAPAPHSDPAKYNDYYTYDYNLLDGINDTIDPASVVRTGDLNFTTPDGRRLAPLFDTHRCRYIVYWKLKDTK